MPLISGELFPSGVNFTPRSLSLMRLKLQVEPFQKEPSGLSLGASGFGINGPGLGVGSPVAVWEIFCLFDIKANDRKHVNLILVGADCCISPRMFQ